MAERLSAALADRYALRGTLRIVVVAAAFLGGSPPTTVAASVVPGAKGSETAARIVNGTGHVLVWMSIDDGEEEWALLDQPLPNGASTAYEQVGPGAGYGRRFEPVSNRKAGARRAPAKCARQD